jgi:nucleoside-diphosphate-sugar epimerase
MLTISEMDFLHIWDKAARCLPALKNSRIFITGGTGFFGRWLLESLAYAVKHLELQTEVVVLSRNPQLFLQQSPDLQNASWLTWMTGDIKDFIFPEGEFTHIVHAATPASASMNRDQPLLMLDTITKGTRRVLEMARLCQVQHFLFASSGAVYGKQPIGCLNIPETYIGTTDPTQLDSAYAVGKLYAEHLCSQYAKQYHLPITIARCFAFVGPYLPLTTHFAIGNFIANALAGEPIHVLGDGTACRSYLYAADLAVWLWTLLCFGQTDTAYNVGSADGVSIAELAKVVSAQLSPSPPVVIATKYSSRHLIDRYVPCTQRAREELKLKAWISLPEAIKRTIEWNQLHDNSQPVSG